MIQFDKYFWDGLKPPTRLELFAVDGGDFDEHGPIVNTLPFATILHFTFFTRFGLNECGMNCP